MEKFYRISEAALLLGVCTKTLRRWDSERKLVCQRTLGGHRRISIMEMERFTHPSDPSPLSRPEGGVAIYGRVSSHEQKTKGDLDRQLRAAQDYCAQHHLNPTYTFADVSIGLNTRRIWLRKLCSLIEQHQITKVILTYPDRLTRFGFEYLETYFHSYGADIQVIHEKPDCSMEEELVQDLIAIVTSFSGRVHGLRSHKNKKPTPKK